MFCQHRAGSARAENEAAPAEERRGAYAGSIYNEANELRPRVSRHEGGSVPLNQAVWTPETASVDDLTGTAVWYGSQKRAESQRGEFIAL